MPRTCIIVADGARARFLRLEAPLEPTLDGGARLVEQHDLVNPEADLSEVELFSDRSGSAHASPHGAAHAFDDHRAAHKRELERRYARRLVEELERFVQREQASRLLLVAPSRLLGALRAELSRERLDGLELVEVNEDLSRRSLGQIQSILATQGLLPGAAAPDVGVFRPRGQAPQAR